MADTINIGNKGENAAAEYLQSNGFRILHRNWRSGRYELDIVAEREGVVHVVEVKCRRRRGLTTPEDAITPAKFRSLMQAAQAYVETFAIDTDVQFDLVAVEYDESGFEVRYVPDAMLPSW